MGFTNEMSPADIGAIVGNNNDGFGGTNGAWWLIILFLFAICGNGWNNGGFGGGQTSSVYEGYVLNNDFSQLSRQIDNGFSEQRGQGIQLANGISSLGYEQLGLMNNINTNIMQTGNAIQSQMAQCCCDIREGISNVNYNMAQNTNGLQSAVQTGFCQTNFNNQNNTRDIIDSQNASTQAILKAIQDNKVEALKDRIAEQNQMINSLQLTASQSAQNEYLINALRPTPVPSFPASNLYGFCGCNNGCGC